MLPLVVNRATSYVASPAISSVEHHEFCNATIFSTFVSTKPGWYSMLRNCVLKHGE